ncbi:MAG: arylsulfatase [Acidimicrobium sp.]|nr:MAG: arylsulfatase [Acidimicrobium sp.]
MAEQKIGRTMAESTPSWDGDIVAPPGSPNIVYCVFDDVGYSDFGCYGSEIATPNIDRLAAGGLRYTNFHTTSLCSPTRAALLTGRNHHAVGMGTLANYDMGYPGYRGRITKDAAMMPEILRGAGYNSFAVGKWHLTPMHHTGPTGPFDQWPTQRGFDRFYGFMDGAMNQWEPFLTEDNHHVATPDDPNYHLSIDITNRALSMITSQKSLAPEKPFFLYMAFGAGHSPHHVPKEMIDEYVPIFEKGWDVTRDERIARQKAMGIIPQDTVLPPRNPGVRAWTELNADEKRLFVRFQAAYAAMLTHTDQQIGRVIDTLETIGQMTNTIFIVMSDNGASQEGSHFGTMHQGRYFERAPMTLEQSIDKIDEIGETQWFNNYPLGWAMAGNTPCKFYKQNTHGGGVRDPLVMHWPAGFDKSEAGTLRHQFHHVSDVSPTMLEVIGVGLPKTMNGVDQMPLHGTPMTYTFAGASAPTKKKVQHFEMLGHRGIVADGWKAVTLHLPRTTMDQDVWELYDLNNDFSETNDLAAANPDKLRELEALWWEEAAKYKVLPVDDGSGSRLRRPVRKKFVLWPGLERVPSDAAPRLTNTSYTIDAHITVPVNGCEGVLLSEGDRWAGYVMFVQDGKPCFHYHFPLERHEVRGTQSLTPGDHVITWKLTKVERASGHGTLSVDGVEVASVDIPRIIRGWMPFNGLHVGRNNGAPVGTTYEAPFPFTGKLHRIEVELLDKVPGPDRDIENRSEMGKQ